MAKQESQTLEEAAKNAWMAEQEAPRRLAKLDAATWEKAASALASTAAEAAQVAGMTAACDAGDNVACNNLSREEEAKKAWLTKLDVPTWGAAAEAVSAVATEMTQPSATNGVEETANT